MHGRLQTDRHSIARRAISVSSASLSPSAANSPAPSGPASDLQVTHTRRVAAECRSQRSREVKSGGRILRPTSNRNTVGWSWSLLGRPSGGVAQNHRRTAGLLARGVSPTPPSRTWIQVQWRKKRRHAAHSRGGGHGSARGLPCSLFTLWQERGTVRGLCPSFGRGCQMTLRPERNPFFEARIEFGDECRIMADAWLSQSPAMTHDCLLIRAPSAIIAESQTDRVLAMEAGSSMLPLLSDWATGWRSAVENRPTAARPPGLLSQALTRTTAEHPLHGHLADGGSGAPLLKNPDHLAYRPFPAWRGDKASMTRD